MESRPQTVTESSPNASIYLLGQLKSATSQVTHTAGAYPGFCSIKRLGVFLSPPPPARMGSYNPSQNVLGHLL